MEMKRPLDWTTIGCVAWYVAAVFAFIAVLLVLAGCAPAKPEVRTVVTTPLAGITLPVPPPALGKRPPDARDALDLALGQVCALVAYVLEADPLLRSVKGEAPRALSYPECQPKP